MKKLLTIKEIQSMQLKLMKLVHDFCNENKLKYYLIGGGMLGAIRHSGFIPWDDDLDIGLIRDDYDKMLNILKEDTFGSDYRVSNYKIDKNCGFYICRIYFKNTFVDNCKIHRLEPHEMYFDIFPLDYLPNDEQTNLHIKSVIRKLKLNMYFATTNFSNPLKKIFSYPFTKMKPIFNKKMSKEIAILRKNEDNSFLCSLFSQYPFDVQKMPVNFYGEPKLYEFEGINFYGPSNFSCYLSKLFGDDYMKLPPLSKRRKHFDTYMEFSNEK